MGFEATDIPDLFVFEPRVFGDKRGFFFESYNHKAFVEATGIDRPFLQDNHSFSGQKGVVRGLHFQRPPFTQAKFVRVVRGSVLDVVVDIRKGSPAYGQHFATELSAENKRQLYVPRGCAHGFVTLTEESEFLYKCDHFYDRDSDGGVLWSDPDLDIEWPLKVEAVTSEKDAQLPRLADLDNPFVFGQI